MGTTEAMKRAIKKYDKEKVERIVMRVPKGQKSVVQEHAENCGESVNAFLNRAVAEAMVRDKENNFNK